MAKSRVKFDEKGDGLARYTIFNYQKSPADSSFDYKVRLDSKPTKWMILYKKNHYYLLVRLLANGLTDYKWMNEMFGGTRPFRRIPRRYPALFAPLIANLEKS